MDHLRCSELLAAYVDGELDAPTTDAVEGHLKGCRECALEARALRSMAVMSVAAMSADERSWLHERVAARVAHPETPATVETVIVPTRAPWWQRVAPALGAVAMLLIIAVGVVAVGNLGSGNDGEGGGAGADGGAEVSSGPLGDEDAGPTPAPTAPGAGGGGSTAESAADAGTETFAALSKTNAPPRFDYLASIGEFELRDRGRFTAPFTNYRRTLRAKDVDSERVVLLNALVRRSPAKLRDQIRACAQTVFQSGPAASLPAFAATGVRNKRDVLVLGFAWTDRETGPVYRYMMWTWPLGGGCSSPIGYEAGRISKE